MIEGIYNCITAWQNPITHIRVLKAQGAMATTLFIYVFLCPWEPQHRMFLRREEKDVTRADLSRWASGVGRLGVMGWRWHQQEAGILFGPLRGLTFCCGMQPLQHEPSICRVSVCRGPSWLSQHRSVHARTHSDQRAGIIRLWSRWTDGPRGTLINL